MYIMLNRVLFYKCGDACPGKWLPLQTYNARISQLNSQPLFTWTNYLVCVKAIPNGFDGHTNFNKQTFRQLEVLNENI